ncbi:succinate dehydrogenase assembly factor 2 [Mesobaculum littorinae]|uniref:FAD assembly factor SdhE n=1 Tax=Mesobaculum littorinae TaxID=2486419 RepID=A0A438AIE5_9RHOB|nr:succinate dehydrogenase assembly factor 2 [Mesobaculum littorinae]RVV98408.1 succinate dehydrogenase assembly factor 2 [Mesobaculum littorinae]
MTNDEDTEIRLKRMQMRSWRRGIKEMDLILGTFAEDRLKTLSDDDLDLYDALLSENDQELYTWVTGREAVPPRYDRLIAEIARHAGAG